MLSALALDLGLFQPLVATPLLAALIIVETTDIVFVLAGVVERFRFLRVGLAAILIFLGARLLLGDFLEVPNGVSLAVIAAALTLSVVASLKWPNAATA